MSVVQRFPGRLLVDLNIDYYIILAVICVLVILMSVYHDDVSLVLQRLNPS